MTHDQRPMTPLAIYIHWPFCKSKCPYCDFNSHVREKVEQARWKKALLSELEYIAAQTPGRTVTSIFFGGGTPSLMPPETAAALIARVRELWKTAEDVEITLEANPTSVEADTFAHFKEAGINRVSLGVQSLRQDELTFLGRGHSVAEAICAVERARATFARYSFDLIYARPRQRVADWEKELSEALELTGGHLSLYQLTIEENTAFHHAYAKGAFALPDEPEAEALYRLTEAMTAAHGLQAYEVSNYAAPGQESRHNLAYWQGREYVGIGPGAHGRLRCGDVERKRCEEEEFSPSHHIAISPHPTRIATQTLKSPERWLEQVEREGHGVEVWQALEAAQEIEERVMMGLRLRQGIGYEDFQAQTGRNLAGHINLPKRDLYIQKGLLENNPSRLQPTLAGRLVLTTLTAELLA